MSRTCPDCWHPMGWHTRRTGCEAYKVSTRTPCACKRLRWWQRVFP